MAFKQQQQQYNNLLYTKAAKTWSGNLGESATHASVFAQLFTLNDKTGEKVGNFESGYFGRKP